MCIRDRHLSDPKVGDEIVDEVPPVDLGRIAAQSAKQVILQKVREAERDRQFEEFKDRKGTIINGVVKREEYGNVIVDMDGRTEPANVVLEAEPGASVRLGLGEDTDPKEFGAELRHGAALQRELAAYVGDHALLARDLSAWLLGPPELPLPPAIAAAFAALHRGLTEEAEPGPPGPRGEAT